MTQSEDEHECGGTDRTPNKRKRADVIEIRRSRRSATRNSAALWSSATSKLLKVERSSRGLRCRAESAESRGRLNSISQPRQRPLSTSVYISELGRDRRAIELCAPLLSPPSLPHAHSRGYHEPSELPEDRRRRLRRGSSALRSFQRLADSPASSTRPNCTIPTHSNPRKPRRGPERSTEKSEHCSPEAIRQQLSSQLSQMHRTVLSTPMRSTSP